MLTAEDARPVPAAALAALDADDFHAIVQASLGHDTDPAVWDALTDPKVIDRTRTVLAGIHVDVLNQLSVANAGLSQAKDEGYALGPEGKAAYFAARAGQGEWRRKATAFRRIVEQRIALVKARTPRPENRPVGSGAARRRYAEALEQLARAVAAHRDRVLSGEGGEDDDDTLWDCLDQITVSDGKGGEQPLAEWLAFLDEVREGRRVTLPRDHHWRCDCGGGHFLTIVWDPDEKRSMMAEVEGYLSIEGDNHTPWRDRIAQAWRVLMNGHSATRVGLILDGAKAREIATVLSDFADDASAGGPVTPP